MEKHGVHALREIAAGAIFGSALLGAGMQDPSTIMAQMQLADFRMVEVMLTATAASAVILYASNRSGYTRISAKQPVNFGFFPYDGNVIGGALLGVGMATTGACPGSALVQAGTGVVSGVYTMLGGVLGAMVYVAIEKTSIDCPVTSGDMLGRNQSATTDSLMGCQRPAHSNPKPPSTTISLGVTPATMVVIWQIFVVGAIALLRTWTTSSVSSDPKTISSVTGGLLMGLSQLASVILTGSTLGSSKAYEDVARNMLGPLLGVRHKISTPAVLFVTGVLFAAQTVNMLHLGRTVSPAPSIWPYVIGGAIMLFGSRLARGCASGHGISGIPTFGWASFITIASAFAAAVAFTASAMT